MRDNSMTEANQELLELVLRETGWSAGPPNPWVYLAGSQIDVRPALLTAVLVVPDPVNALTVRTHLPILVDKSAAREIATFCIGINAAVRDGMLSIDAGGTPQVTSKALLPTEQRAAAALIIDTVTRNRALADTLDLPLLAIGRGQTAAEVLANTHAANLLPLTTPPRTPAVFDLTQTPPPPAEFMNHPNLAVLPRAEVDTLGRFETQQNEDLHRPVCAGPIVIHSDGAIECYGCRTPPERFHGNGATRSCTPGRTFGNGHQCDRCRKS